MAGPKRINWVDMIVRDPDKVSRFYEQAVGLKREAVDEGEGHTSYILANEAGEEVLGICDAAVFPDWVGGWLPYLDVSNFDEKVAEVEAAGGEIFKQMTMDFNWEGQRFCLVRDPSGAPMMLCEERVAHDG